MADRITPPSWTEWTRAPNDRTPQRKVFDDILGELRKEGLIEVRGSLFVYLARYSYLHIKNALVEVKAFLQSVPDSVFGTTPPNYRLIELKAVLKILAAAGLITLVDGTEDEPVTILLTERQAPGEVARTQIVHQVLRHLREAWGGLDTLSLIARSSSFPTPESAAKATGTNRELLVPGEVCVPVQDRPESNETNPNPFLQTTIDKVTAPLILLQFWPLPDPKAEAGATPPADPEFQLLLPGEMSLEALVRDHCLPIFDQYFASPGHQDEAAGIQAKYASYMHKYREKFTASGGLPANDRIDKVLATSDPTGEAFANAVYVVVQVLRKSSTTIVYQAARIAWARCMAQRVAKRQGEKEAATRTQDSGLLVARLRASSRPLSLEDLKRTPDATKKKDIGSKYSTLSDLLPLVPAKEGLRAVVFDIQGQYVHRENLIRAFLDLREREALAQQERLALEWAHEGIPPNETIFLADKDVSPPFLRAWELLHQERLFSDSTSDFVRDFLPADLDLADLVHWLWPDGRKAAATPTELVTKGLDVVLYEDRDRLRKRSLSGVLGLTQAYPDIVKATWNIIYMEDGMVSFVIRKILALFGQRPGGSNKAKAAKKGGAGGLGAAVGGSPGSGSGGSGGGAGSTEKVVDARAQKVAELKKLKQLAPLAADRNALIQEREKAAGQWCFKLDAEAGRRTRQTVDDEIARYANQIKIESLTEENSAKVALFLVDKSPTLRDVTSSRAFHRYLYLTALQRRTESLSR